MDLVEQLKAFVATAQTGSFTAAADQLHVSNRLTSKYVAELEARLGTRLLQRTTRKVGLTPAGEDLLARVPALLDELDDLLGDVAEGSKGFSGTVRISAPVTLGEVYISAMLGRFADRNPGLTVDLRLSDQYIDLASDGIDLAFRAGESRSLSVKARRIGWLRTMVVASPDYIARHGAPATIEDLATHNCIIDTNRRVPRQWIFHLDGARLVAQVRGQLHVNSARAAVELAMAGHGIANSPRFALRAGLDSGRLVQVMEGFESPSVPMSAVYLEGRALPRKLRALIDFAVQDLREADIL